MGYNILVISSYPLAHSAGLAEDMCRSFVKGGHSVDFLTKYREDRKLEGVCNISVYSSTKDESRPKQKRSLKSEAVNFLKKIPFAVESKRTIQQLLSRLHHSKQGSRQLPRKSLKYIMYPNEQVTDVPVELVLSKIEPKYDFIVITFWEFMLTTKTIRAIWEKLHIPILLSSPDYAPATGGCHYFEECNHYLNGCGYCPGQRESGPNDLSAQNFQFKKDTYELGKIAFLGNTWMNQIVEQANIFPKEKIFRNEIVINEEDFSPADPTFARERLGIPNDKKHIFMFRSRHLPRKGNKEIVEAFRRTLSKLDNDIKKQILIILIGEDYAVEKCKELGIDVLFLGRVNKDALIDTYRASTFFISASLDDAGPSMINQSILCGTPVICFDNGTAIDVIEEGRSGFKCETGDIEGLAKCLLKGISISPDAYEAMRRMTRSIGMDHNSYATSCRNIEQIYKSLLKS